VVLAKLRIAAGVEWVILACRDPLNPRSLMRRQLIQLFEQQLLKLAFVQLAEVQIAWLRGLTIISAHFGQQFKCAEGVPGVAGVRVHALAH
jgi:hypothetical protein